MESNKKKKLKKEKNYNKYKQITIELSEFNQLDGDSQKEKIRETLDKMWDGKVKVENGYIMKCIKLSIAKLDDELHLPKGLLVEKDSREMVFSFKEHRNTLLLFFLFGALLLIGAFSATYSAIILIQQNQLNVDIDGDGIPDINIDIDEDGTPDINIDTDGDKTPDVNVDYKGNRNSVFSIDTDGDGKGDSNLVNNATEENSTCKINCDANGDGWPDYNIDLDGDGTPDVDIDTNGDKSPDLNIDLNGDGKADINIDEDNDGKCDKNCTETGLGDQDYKPNGSSTVTGDPNNHINSSQLMVNYEDYGDVIVSEIFPDDQEGVNNKLPEKTFVLTNQSNYTISYKLTWIIYKNTYTSQNFKYKLEATNGGFNQDYTTAPWEDTVIADYVTIPPLATQTYKITFKLVGIGAPQNFDQNKLFSGYIKVGE